MSSDISRRSFVKAGLIGGLSLTVGTGLVACSTGTESKPASDSSTNAETTPTPQSTGSTDVPAAPKALVVYFSCTGHTAAVASSVAESLGADLHEIVPQQPYSSADIDYNSDCRANDEQNDDSARPAIASSLPDLDAYDTVLIGHPIWWGKEPRIIDTLLEGCSLSGKNVAEFCTSGSSGIEEANTRLKQMAEGTNWLGAQRFAIGASADEVGQWLSEIGLAQ